MSSEPRPSRRDRILDAAEHIFAEAGFAGASLRDIVLEAKVNLATVYYYFGSKSGLMEAVLKRRFGPLRQEHLDLLKSAQEVARGGPLGVEQILEAMLLPPLRLAVCDSARRQAVMRLIGRIVSEPSQQIQDILHVQRAEVREAFLRALQESLPNVPRPDLLWRMEFVWGALTSILCNPKKIEKDSHGECSLSDTPKVLAEMIRFFSPGFQAGATNGSAQNRNRRTKRDRD
jgi:AcrR family transcriptional regulator